MTPSCPIQFLKSAAGSISNTTVDPLVSARHFVLPAATGSGAIMIVDLPCNLDPVSSRYFFITLPAVFNVSLSLNPHAPLNTRSSGIPSIVVEVLRRERPTTKTAFSGTSTSYTASPVRAGDDSICHPTGKTNRMERFVNSCGSKSANIRKPSSLDTQLTCDTLAAVGSETLTL